MKKKNIIIAAAAVVIAAVCGWRYGRRSAPVRFTYVAS